MADQYVSNLVEALNNLDLAAVEKLCELVRNCQDTDRTIFTMGNGGSASTASHYIIDWVKMSLTNKQRKLNGYSLVDNIGILTAYANDVAYSDVFSSQLASLMKPNDVVIAISGSGNSENIIKAIEYANNYGAKTVAIVGFDGGKIKSLADLVINANVNDMQIVEDIHLSIGHIVMKYCC
jgi:D-sedoheptulose 7-phosphate isomerase